MDVASIFIILAFLATVGAIIVGLVSMFRGKEYDKTHSGPMMWARVGMETITLFFMGIAAAFIV